MSTRLLKTALILIAVFSLAAFGYSSVALQAQSQPPVARVPEFTAPEVTIDVGVLLEKTHTFLPGLVPSNFRVYEDGQEQKILGFRHTESPAVVLILCDSSAIQFLHQMSTFTEELRPQDYVALMTFGHRTEIVTDFTQDKHAFTEAIEQLPASGQSERRLFDALDESIGRLSQIDGQKYILLLSSGSDSSSRTTLNQLLDKTRESPDLTIFTIFTSSPATGVQSLAQTTGGMSYTPQTAADASAAFKSIGEAIHSKYELIYHPTNSKQDGAYRRIKVELVDDDGHPLQMQDEKHKPLKYTLAVREGYLARQPVQ